VIPLFNIVPPLCPVGRTSTGRLRSQYNASETFLVANASDDVGDGVGVDLGEGGGGGGGGQPVSHHLSKRSVANSVASRNIDTEQMRAKPRSEEILNSPLKKILDFLLCDLGKWLAYSLIRSLT
jgi:hypothetical protein